MTGIDFINKMHLDKYGSLSIKELMRRCEVAEQDARLVNSYLHHLSGMLLAGEIAKAVEYAQKLKTVESRQTTSNPTPKPNQITG